jgi:hypothetical protein
MLSDDQIDRWRARVASFSADFNGPLNVATFDLELLDLLKAQGNDEIFSTPMWREHLDEIEKLLLAGDSRILDDRLVRYAIYLTIAEEWAKSQMPYLRKKLSESQLKKYLMESGAFQQTIIDPNYKTSESRVNHLTHLLCWEEKTKAKIADLDVLVEFGGGYGGMTKLLKTINDKSTIIVIDFPIMILLQSYYLGKSLGKEALNFVLREKLEIMPGKVNYVPVALAHLLPNDLAPDIFIATWSLSESNEKTQSLIEDKEFFSTSHLLYGYRFYEHTNPRQPCSNPTVGMLDRKIAYHGPTFWCLDGEQYYLFS